MDYNILNYLLFVVKKYLTNQQYLLHHYNQHQADKKNLLQSLFILYLDFPFQIKHYFAL